jgi:hypothetical protein
MKSIAFACLLLITINAQAASPLESYIAARDGYIAKFAAIEDSGKFNDRTQRDVQRALQDLEKQLRGIIGPVAIKGFSANGKINLDTLVRSDVGFGGLDALVYTSQGGSKETKSQAYATTSALFDRWLKEHADNWVIAKSEVPKDASAALASETFYTFAISADAAVAKYAELPLAKPAKARFAVAMLAARSQDDAPITPNEIIVSVLHESRVFLATAPVATKITAIPACQKAWDDAEAAAEAAHAAYRESNLQDQNTLDLSTRLREEGVAAFHRCYAERAKGQPFFGALVRQAQGLLERLPAK